MQKVLLKKEKSPALKDNRETPEILLKSYKISHKDLLTYQIKNNKDKHIVSVSTGGPTYSNSYRIHSFIMFPALYSALSQGSAGTYLQQTHSEGSKYTLDSPLQDTHHLVSHLGAAIQSLKST